MRIVTVRFGRDMILHHRCRKDEAVDSLDHLQHRVQVALESSQS